MKLLLSVVVILALASNVYSIVCLPDYCATATCEKVTAETCGGKIVTNGGFCGCCDSCVNVLNEGESCFAMLLMGVPAKSVCDDGLTCDATTMTCQK